MGREQEEQDKIQTGRALQEIAQPMPQVFDIHIASDGSWYHEGGVIGRPALVKLFASVLRREDDGSFWLVTPVERGTITVADAPFIVTSMQVEGAGRDQKIIFTTNVDDILSLSADHPLVMRPRRDADDDASTNKNGIQAQAPYIMVRDGLEAKLSRPVFYELAELAVPGDGGALGVWSDSIFFDLEG
ncbi:MAG: DUF1285 domain-containing protein [Alphaproteobacteria bacterium]